MMAGALHNRFSKLALDDSGDNTDFSDQEDENFNKGTEGERKVVHIRTQNKPNPVCSKENKEPAHHQLFKKEFAKTTAYLNSLKSKDIRDRAEWLCIHTKTKLSNKQLRNLVTKHYRGAFRKIFDMAMLTTGGWYHVQQPHPLQIIMSAQPVYQPVYQLPRHLPPADHYFDYAVIVDFEATCESNAPSNFKHEIIQFPAVLVDIRTGVAVHHFDTYVRPVLNPRLSAFCTELTGITQAQVDAAPEFPDALKLFEKWLASHKLGGRFTIVCDSHFDMGKFLYTQCEISNIPYPSYCLRWINLKKAYERLYGAKWYKLQIALEQLGLQFVGRLHNGLDDAWNIGRIFVKLILSGYVPMCNERILLEKHEQEQNHRPNVRFALKTVAPMSADFFKKVYTRMMRFQKYLESGKENENSLQWSPPSPPAPASSDDESSGSSDQ